MLEHGGQIHAAARHFGIPVAEWLDLSTGINPIPFTPPPTPEAVWQRLPQEQDGLLQAASRYYGTTHLLAVAGSQAAIQLLPKLRKHCRVGVLHPAYSEHAHAWRSAGHEVLDLTLAQIDTAIDRLDVLVLIQPNNPTGTLFPHMQLLEWHNSLQARQGWLIIDEAFIEATTHTSMAQAEMPSGLIVLRSIGKFFGLAGARVGFVLAHAELLVALQESLGPWNVAGPSRFVAQAALRDTAWQIAAHTRLQQDCTRLAQLLNASKLRVGGGCGLFQWVQTTQAEAIHQRLAQRGILTRLFIQPTSLRFGLPGNPTEWARLQTALAEILI